MVEKTIAVLEGDGIGPEIMAVSLEVLAAVAERFGHTFDLEFAPFGAQAYFDLGHPFPEQTRELVDRVDATLKGPIGLSVDRMNEIPTDKQPEGHALLPLRKQL